MPVSTPELSKSEQGAVPSTTARSRRPKAAVRAKALRGADQQPNAPADEKFYTVEQVAEDLNVSPRTVRRWIQSKALVAHRFVSIRSGPRRVYSRGLGRGSRLGFAL